MEHRGVRLVVADVAHTARHRWIGSPDHEHRRARAIDDLDNHYRVAAVVRPNAAEHRGREVVAATDPRHHGEWRRRLGRDAHGAGGKELAVYRRAPAHA